MAKSRTTAVFRCAPYSRDTGQINSDISYFDKYKISEQTNLNMPNRQETISDNSEMNPITELPLILPIIKVGNYFHN